MERLDLASHIAFLEHAEPFRWAGTVMDVVGLLIESAGPAVALYAESEILFGDPSCVTASAGGLVRFVCCSVMVPLRAATQVFAVTE